MQPFDFFCSPKETFIKPILSGYQATFRCIPIDYESFKDQWCELLFDWYGFKKDPYFQI